MFTEVRKKNEKLPWQGCGEQKKITQFFLGVINFYLFRIIKRLHPFLLSRNSCRCLILLKQNVQNEDNINKGTRETNGNIATNAYSKENENQGICGTQQIFEESEKFVSLSAR